MNFHERCRIAAQCLPDAPYRTSLEALQSEMLAEIDRLRAELARCGKDNCMGRKLKGNTNWVTEAASAVAVASEREMCAQYLRDAAERLAPEGARTTQGDRHTARVLATKGDELAHGVHLRD